MDNGFDRQWIQNPFYRNYKSKIDETEITVMSYNLLAQDLIDKHTYLYSRHNGPDLNYDQRSQRLTGEIERIRPDILCLQEVKRQSNICIGQCITLKTILIDARESLNGL